MWAGSSVGVTPDCELNGSGSIRFGDEIFRWSRPALGPTQPILKWVPGLPRGYGTFAGIKCGRSVLLNAHQLYCRGHGRVELYLYPPSGPHRACNGIAFLPTPYTVHILQLQPNAPFLVHFQQKACFIHSVSLLCTAVPYRNVDCNLKFSAAARSRKTGTIPADCSEF